jgi:hypothetical protein
MRLPMHDGQKARPLQERGDEFLLAALGVLALQDCETSRKHAARDVTLELVAHESRQR